MLAIAELTAELNERARHHAIGALQEIRRELKGLSRPPARHIFGRGTTHDEYAFHLGGRTELQFNVGFDSDNGQDYIRHGVAFSLEPSQTLPDIELLLPQIRRFNEYLRQYPNDFADLRMWYYFNGSRSTTAATAPISWEIVRPHTFIFLGLLNATTGVDYDAILDTFDRLLPLYRYVQGKEKFPAIGDARKTFVFVPGCSLKPSQTVSSRSQAELDVYLRHNELQYALYQYLVEKYGADAVGTEQGSCAGGSIDVVVRLDRGYHFYEIKTASSVRACVREALAQLLDYSFWPGAQQAERLIIVGEPAPDNDSRQFLSLLRTRFSIPIDYKQFDMQSNRLGP